METAWEDQFFSIFGNKGGNLYGPLGVTEVFSLVRISILFSLLIQPKGL